MNVEGFAVRDNPPDRAPEKARKWIEELEGKRFQVFPNLKSFAERLVKTNPRLPMERALFLSKYLTKTIKQGGKSKVVMAADPLHKLSDPYALPKEYHYSFWEKIQAQCLLVYADQSEMNVWVQTDDLSKQLQEWRSHFPKESKWVTISDCGHMVHHEKPEALACEILKFMSEDRS
ncbi:MAG: alpha/beta hydrolase [Deltaproteobacteria bacterium]|nr:MAG: alpha/beta hydrolase [Deltaproteobacteria bacterium]